MFPSIAMSTFVVLWFEGDFVLMFAVILATRLIPTKLRISNVSSRRPSRLREMVSLQRDYDLVPMHTLVCLTR